MLSRIYIDNYKCFGNFEYLPQCYELLLGDNGTGKSTVFEVLARLRAMMIDGIDVVEAFPSSSRMRWQEQDQQTFEFDITGHDGSYHYALVIHHDADMRKSVIRQETLSFAGTPLFTVEAGNAWLYENGTGAPVLVDQTRSGLFFIAQRDNSMRVKWFLDWMRRLFIVRIDPNQMRAGSDEDVVHPALNMANFASWYRHLVQEQSEVISEVTAALRQVLPGFSSLSLQKEGEQTRILKALFTFESKKVKFDLTEFSEGQRVLLVLYTLLGVLRETAALLCIDEPDNYVALKEIQPWLQEIEALTEDDKAQVLLISHHPEVINYYAPSAAKLFYRQQSGLVRIKPFQVSEANAGLLPAEIMARGWEDE